MPKSRDDKDHGGAARFTFSDLTPFSRARYRSYMSQFETDNDEIREMASNIAWLAIHTQNVEVIDDGVQWAKFSEFWNMIQSGAPSNEWIMYFGDNVHVSIYDDWFAAYNSSQTADVPRAEVHGRALSDGEKTDPN